MDPASQQPESRRPMQFGLRRLFAITSMVAAVFGVVHWFGPGLTLLVLVIGGVAVGAYALPARKPDKWIGSLTAALFGMGLAALIFPACQRASICSRRSQCRNNLKQIGLSLQIYADVYHSFPPAYVADENGRPMHSWRVLILPFIEEDALYRQYDFNEPWDGPHNRLLASKMPECYRCPSEGPPGSGTTSYLAIVGAETVWPGDGCTALAQFKDGMSNTLAVIEVAASGVNWMSPCDLPFSALNQGVNPKTGLGVSSRHAGSANSVFCDGHASWLDNTTPTATLKALATPGGGEAIVGDY